MKRHRGALTAREEVTEAGLTWLWDTGGGKPAGAVTGQGLTPPSSCSVLVGVACIPPATMEPSEQVTLNPSEKEQNSGSFLCPPAQVPDWTGHLEKQPWRGDSSW